MRTAYTDAMGRSNPTSLNLGGGSISGLTFAPGLYKWGTSLDVTGTIYCNGTAQDSESEPNSRALRSVLTPSPTF